VLSMGGRDGGVGGRTGLGGKSRQGGHFNHVMTLYILVPLLLLCRNKALDAALYLQSSPKPFSEFFLSLWEEHHTRSLSLSLSLSLCICGKRSIMRGGGISTGLDPSCTSSWQ
jgi:hypothetical protein